MLFFFSMKTEEPARNCLAPCLALKPNAPWPPHPLYPLQMLVYTYYISEVTEVSPDTPCWLFRLFIIIFRMQATLFTYNVSSFLVGIPVLPEQVLPFNTDNAVLKFIPSLQYEQSLTFRYILCSSSPCLVLVFLLISTKLQYTLSTLRMKKFGQTESNASCRFIKARV